MDYVFNSGRKINIPFGPDEFQRPLSAEAFFHHQISGHDAYGAGSSRMAVDQDSLAVSYHLVNECNGIVAQPQIVSGPVHQWDADHIQAFVVFITAVLLQAKNSLNVAG